MDDAPTTWPLAFRALAPLNVPPRVPKSTIPPPAVQENAWIAVSPAMMELPTTWPLPLTAMAPLLVPPRVPRSVGPAKTLVDDAPTSTGSESRAKIPNSKPAKQASIRRVLGRVPNGRCRRSYMNHCMAPPPLLPVSRRLTSNVAQLCPRRGVRAGPIRPRSGARDLNPGPHGPEPLD